MKSFGKYRAQACAILGENSSADILNDLTWKLGTMDIQKVLTAKDAEMALALAAKDAEMLLAAKDAEMLLALAAKDAEMDSYRSSAKKALASKDMKLDDAGIILKSFESERLLLHGTILANCITFFIIGWLAHFNHF